MPWEKLLELTATIAGTLAAAYWGAKLAFEFNTRQEAERLRAQRVEECNKALLTLTLQLNRLVNYRDQILEPHRHNPARHIFLAPSLEQREERWHVNAASLSFLAETQAADLPLMLALQSEKFQTIMGGIERRSNRHIEAQVALEANEHAMAETATLEEIESVIGRRLAITLRQSTDSLYEHVDEAISSLAATGRDAKNVLRTVFPGAQIIGFGLLPAETTQMQTPPI